jgi:hypothetical protein
MGEGFQTLNEFLLHTKGVLYLLGIGSLVAFVLFWKFVHDREKKDE